MVTLGLGAIKKIADQLSLQTALICIRWSQLFFSLAVRQAGTLREAASSLPAPHILSRSALFPAPLITLLSISQLPSQQNAFKTYRLKKKTVLLKPGEGKKKPTKAFDIPLDTNQLFQMVLGVVVRFLFWFDQHFEQTLRCLRPSPHHLCRPGCVACR